MARYEDAFQAIRETVNDANTVAIVNALEIVAGELEDLNVAAAQLMDLPDTLMSIVSCLERSADANQVTARIAETNLKTMRENSDTVVGIVQRMEGSVDQIALG